VALAAVGGLGALALGALVAVGSFLGQHGDWFDGATACNATEPNEYIADALTSRLPDGTLRSLANTGSDCDARRTGSVSAAWGANAQPASVIDQLMADGWARLDPPGHAESDQTVLTTERDSRVFVARFGPDGMTVDVAHKSDADGVRQIRSGSVSDSEE